MTTPVLRGLIGPLEVGSTPGARLEHQQITWAPFTTRASGRWPDGAAIARGLRHPTLASRAGATRTENVVRQAPSPPKRPAPRNAGHPTSTAIPTRSAKPMTATGSLFDSTDLAVADGLGVLVVSSPSEMTRRVDLETSRPEPSKAPTGGLLRAPRGRLCRRTLKTPAAFPSRRDRRSVRSPRPRVGRHRRCRRLRLGLHR